MTAPLAPRPPAPRLRPHHSIHEAVADARDVAEFVSTLELDSPVRCRHLAARAWFVVETLEHIARVGGLR